MLGLFRTFVLVATFLMTVAATAPAWALTIESTGRPADSYSKLNVTLRGVIQKGDEIRVERELRKRNENGVFVWLTSTGGDIETAMAIGRALRKAEAAVSTDQCQSSCVLIVAGAVERIIDEGAIAVHRPYFVDLPASTAQATIAKRRNALKRSIALYLDEMNVSQGLLEAMESTHPEQLRVLSEDELARFNLSAPDPVWDEKNVARAAADYGIVSAEYRRRRALAEKTCSQHKTFSNAYSQCEQEVLWNLPAAEYERRLAILREWREAAVELTNGVRTPQLQAEFKACGTAVLVRGATSCPPFAQARKAVAVP